MRKILCIFISLLSFSVNIKVKLNYSLNSRIDNKDGYSIIEGNKYRGKIYKKASYIINEVELEEYLKSVVASEIEANYPIEAIKAQAIAARTYAINAINNPKSKYFDVYSDTRSQAYKGMKKEDDRISEAVIETKGEIIVYDNKPINAMYYYAIGDYTQDIKEIFNKDVPYLKRVEDFTTDMVWEYVITKSSFDSKIKMKTNSIKQEGNNIYINNKLYTTHKIRTLIGNTKVKSTNYIIELKNNKVYFKGYGSGHGVGMSQLGAKRLAEIGYKYRYILEHYYTDIEIKRIDDNE